METSLEENMDADRESRSPQDSRSNSPPAINGKHSGASQDGPNGVAIAKEKPIITDVQW